MAERRGAERMLAALAKRRSQRLTPFACLFTAMCGNACGQIGPEESHELVLTVPPDAALSEAQQALTTERQPTSQCLSACDRTPPNEPVGWFCVLTGSLCRRGTMHCFYQCEPIEDDIPIDGWFRN
jgi:hypothetical protein